MTRAPAVSVCIPTRNRADWLREAVASVLAQSFEDLEVVVSDNASDDHTPEVLRSFGDPRLRHGRNPELISITENWNRAFAMARGRYLTLLPDDDVMLADNVARKVAFLEANPGAGLVHSRYHRIDARGEVTRRDIGKYFLAERREPLVLEPPESLERLLESNYIHESTTLFRRECRDKVGEFLTTLRFSADWNCWLRIAYHYGIGYLPEPLILWRDHGQSSTQQHIIVDNKPTILLLADRLIAVSALEKYVVSQGGDVRASALRRIGQDIYDIGNQVIRDGNDPRSVRRAVLGIARRYPALLADRRVAVTLAQSLIGPQALDAIRRLVGA